MFAFKHANESTPELIRAMDAAHAELQAAHRKGFDLAATFPFPVKPFYRRGWGGEHRQVALRPESITAMGEAEMPEGWRYLKGRDTIEPRPGKRGEHARELLESIQLPKVQPRTVLHDSGMPEYVTKPAPGLATYMVLPTFFEHDGAIYSAVDVPTLSTDFAGNESRAYWDQWEECKLSEYHAALEALQARLAADKEAASA